MPCPPTKQMQALIIGATGATGKDLVQVLLHDDDYAKVVAFVRRKSGLQHPKYVEILTDFDKLEEVAASILGDVWFHCLGTTLKIAGSKENQWHIDHDVPLGFAEIARRNEVPKAVVVSSYGASAASRVFYSKMKGSLDDAILRLGFECCLIFRPGFLIRKNTDRVSERLIAVGLQVLNRLGLFRRFQPLPTMTLSQKLAEAPKACTSGTHLSELDAIFRM